MSAVKLNSQKAGSNTQIFYEAIIRSTHVNQPAKLHVLDDKQILSMQILNNLPET